MTDKSDLIEQIKLHVGFMKDCDNWVSDDHHSNVIKKLCIESDEAREYWVGFIDDSVLKKVKELENECERFIEQACEAIETHPTLNDFCKGKAIKAIRDRLEGEE